MSRLIKASAKYIVAVSGGVDSVVLLDMLSRQSKLGLVVAHFDHGMREDSIADRIFVQQLAKERGLSFEYGQGRLGPDASEATARKARYEFLGKVQKKYRANALVTAHHQDDLIETAIINLLRGTYRKGLSSLKSTDTLVRPLLNKSKRDLYDYAKSHKLEWREDPSNADTSYLRNYVRLVLVPRMDLADPAWRQKFLKKLEQGAVLNTVIDKMMDNVTAENVSRSKSGWSISRQVLLDLPGPVGRELLARILSKTGTTPLSQAKLKQVWLFAKTAKEKSTLSLSKQSEIVIDNGNVLVVTKTSKPKVK